MRNRLLHISRTASSAFPAIPSLSRISPYSLKTSSPSSSRLASLQRHLEMTSGTTSRLAELRQHMHAKQVDIYVVPSEDAHQSEYVCAADKRREFISGFTGSAGTAVITADKAALFTDGRYFNQAAKQLDQNWQLMKVGLVKVPTWQEWVAELAQDGKVIGVDPAVITVDGARELKKKLKSMGKGELVGVQDNLVDKVWASRPPRPENPVFILPEKFTGIPLEKTLIRQTLPRKDFRITQRVDREKGFRDGSQYAR